VQLCQTKILCIVNNNGIGIVFSDKINIEPIKIITLVQTQPKRYQLKGQNQLIFKQEMPDNIKRIELIESLLKTLET
jgi:transcription-repair coupling factor (superfamily II helicase)